MLDPLVVRQQVENLKIVHPELLEDDDAWISSLESETDFTELLTSIVRRIEDTKALVIGTKDRFEELKARKDRFEHRVETLRELAFKIMHAAELAKVELPEATLSLRAGTQQLAGEANGPPPSPTHEAGHTCGRGEDGCVNPHHMIWQTHSENQLLRRLQQTGPAKRYKLTPAQVDDIRALKGRATIADIASQFGVSENNIKFIFAGKIWKTPSSLMRRELTSEEVRAIRATPWQVKTARQWSTELGVPRTVIDRVRSGITYKWVEDQEQTA